VVVVGVGRGLRVLGGRGRLGGLVVGLIGGFAHLVERVARRVGGLLGLVCGVLGGIGLVLSEFQCRLQRLDAGAVVVDTGLGVLHVLLERRDGLRHGLLGGVEVLAQVVDALGQPLVELDDLLLGGRELVVAADGVAVVGRVLGREVVDLGVRVLLGHAQPPYLLVFPSVRTSTCSAPALIRAISSTPDWAQSPATVTRAVALSSA